MRRDRLSYFGYHRETTPFVDSLAREGWVFDQAISPTYWSTPAHYSMLTGLHPHQHGAHQEAADDNKRIHPMPQMELLPVTLKGMGYDTWLISGGSWMKPAGLTRGINHYYDFDLFGNSPGWGDRMVDTVQRDFKAKKPYFLLIDFRDIHVDYHVPDRFRKWTDKRNLYTSPTEYYCRTKHPWNAAHCQEVNDRYDQAVFYEDHVTRRLMDWLCDKKLLINTIVIICGDHGEALCDRQFQGHPLFEHTCVLYDEIIRVPVVVWGAGIMHKEIKPPMGTRKLYDLVLGAAQGKIPIPESLTSKYTLSWTTHPKHIARIFRRMKPGYDNSYIFSPKLAARSNDWKYIKVDRSGEEMYHLAVDPGETKNVTEAHELVNMKTFLSSQGL